MPGAVPRTSTNALTNATLKYGLEIADKGLEKAAAGNKAVAMGVNCYLGKLTNKNVADAHGYEFTDLASLIGRLRHGPPNDFGTDPRFKGIDPYPATKPDGERL